MINISFRLDVYIIINNPTLMGDHTTGYTVSPTAPPIMNTYIFFGEQAMNITQQCWEKPGHKKKRKKEYDKHWEF